MNSEESKQAENQWPSVGLAYDFVKPSYDWAQSRLDVANSRLQFLVTFSASVTVATPIFAKTLVDNVDFASPWFITAIVTFVFIAVFGTFELARNNLTLLGLQMLWDKWLGWSEWEFKKNAISHAAQHQKSNVSMVNRKAKFASAMSILLVIEVLCIVVWVATST